MSLNLVFKLNKFEKICEKFRFELKKNFNLGKTKNQQKQKTISKNKGKKFELRKFSLSSKKQK